MASVQRFSKLFPHAVHFDVGDLPGSCLPKRMPFGGHNGVVALVEEDGGRRLIFTPDSKPCYSCITVAGKFFNWGMRAYEIESDKDQLEPCMVEMDPEINGEGCVEVVDLGGEDEVLPKVDVPEPFDEDSTLTDTLMNRSSPLEASEIPPKRCEINSSLSPAHQTITDGFKCRTRIVNRRQTTKRLVQKVIFWGFCVSSQFRSV